MLVVITGLLTGVWVTSQPHSPDTLHAEIVATYPHDATAYTQGLQWQEGRLWESTGHYGRSSIREIDLSTGGVLRRKNLLPLYFGEGLTWHDGEIWFLTWREQTAMVLDPATLEMTRSYSYDGEGWGLTSDGRHLIMSDGTSRLMFMNPHDFSLARDITVTEKGQIVNNLNELEWVNGTLFANVYLTDRIVRIDPADGRVTGTLDLSGLRQQLPSAHLAEALNGIAYRADNGHYLVTGKNWPLLFEVRIQ